MAIISSEVATGRWIKGAEIFAPDDSGEGGTPSGGVMKEPVTGHRHRRPRRHGGRRHPGAPREDFVATVAESVTVLEQTHARLPSRLGGGTKLLHILAASLGQLLLQLGAAGGTRGIVGA